MLSYHYYFIVAVNQLCMIYIIPLHCPDPNENGGGNGGSADKGGIDYGSNCALSAV